MFATLLKKSSNFECKILLSILLSKFNKVDHILDLLLHKISILNGNTKQGGLFIYIEFQHTPYSTLKIFEKQNNLILP